MSAPPQSGTPTAHPTIQRFFDTSLYLLLFTAFAMLAGTGKLDTSSLVLGSSALVVKGYLLLRKSDIKIPEQWTTYLTLIYVAFFALDYFLISRTFIGALVHMVLFAAMLKVFSIHRERDHVYLGVLSFGMVLAAAVLTVDSLFFGIFCLFVLLAVTTFVSMEMRRSWIAAQTDTPSEARNVRDLRRLPASVFRACVLLVLSIVVGTVTLFFLIPRKPSTGYLGAFSERNDLTTGFSEEVRLGDIGQIQQSSAVVMHVKFEPQTKVPGDLRWRGVALTNFDGRRWTGPVDDGSIEANAQGLFPATIQTSRLFYGKGRRISYRVSLEPFGARVFFVLPEAIFISGRYQTIRIDSTGTVFNTDSSRAVTDYGVLSEIPPPMPANLRAGNDPGVSGLIYLQPPPNLDLRIATLAEQITAGERTPYLKASAIERYLASTYGYTLQLPRVTPRDPIANFLFERKKGHCEYFASSMAVMLRTLGIPSRIVNGFRGGEYNDVTGSYIIRARDAHSWVEAYFPGYGWYTFDPTPSSTEVPNTWTRLYFYADAMREFWHDWIVNYDTGHQSTLGIVVVRTSHSGFEQTRDSFRSFYEKCLRLVKTLRRHFQRNPNTWTTWLMIGFTLLIFLLIGPKLFLSIRKIRITRKPRIEPHSAATIWYSRALKLLARQGLRKTATQTPQEFLKTIRSTPVRQRAERFTLHYERARFGASPADAEKLPELYRELETAGKD